MRSSKRAFAFLILGTLALLLYVHEQVSIIQVSYSIEKKERDLARLSEDYKTARFKVARLRSPHVLNERMKKLSLNLTAPTDQKVVRVLKPKPVPVETEVRWLTPFQFLSLLHFVKEAQAKTSRG
ncbi:MAG: hypothetical protein HY351_02465 [Candidatus Omnitrophica bacterium]|nr:hypothetical protein [Candidatus Omnitrophota bacterium]